jgi:hypothetical protein
LAVAQVADGGTGGADKSLARSGRKQATATEDFHYTIIIPTKCTRLSLLKSQDITICNFVLYFCPYMFQPTWVIFRGLNASVWLKLLLITIY